MSSTIITSVKIWLVVCLIAAGIGTGYTVFTGGTPYIGGSVGFTIGALLAGFEIFVVQRPRGQRLRRLPLLVFVFVTGFIWVALITVALFVVPLLFGVTAYVEHYQASAFTQDIIFAFIVGLGFNAIIRTSSLIGHRVLFNFLIGRYNQPLREERVFMFLDLKNSTLMAEVLGDIAVQSLIAQFFSDIADPIARHGGETHRYIGDEIVVTWKLKEAVRNAQCIRCALAIDRLADRRGDWFRNRYGFAPEFRIGMHGGPVVVSEIGDGKREIVYFGATINTAARLCAICKKLDRHFLVTKQLLDMIELPNTIRLHTVEDVSIAGVNHPIAVAEPVDPTVTGDQRDLRNGSQSVL